MEQVARVVVDRTVLRALQAGPLRLVCPRRPGPPWVVTSNLGGGLVDGDAVALEVEVEPGATCVIASQASQKVYRGRTRQRTRVRVGERGAAIVVPDPVVPFRGAAFVQDSSFELAASASLVAIDTLTAGRVAHGERWAATEIDSTLRVEVAGRPLVIDRLALGENAPARMRRFDALATCVVIGAGAESALARTAAPAPGAGVVIAGSPIANGAVIRIAGTRVELVSEVARAVVRDACAALGVDPWARRW